MNTTITNNEAREFAAANGISVRQAHRVLRGATTVGAVKREAGKRERRAARPMGMERGEYDAETGYYCIERD